MYCTQCGTNLTQDCKFCTKCGKAQQQQSASAAWWPMPEAIPPNRMQQIEHVKQQIRRRFFKVVFIIYGCIAAITLLLMIVMLVAGDADEAAEVLGFGLLIGIILLVGTVIPFLILRFALRLDEFHHSKTCNALPQELFAAVQRALPMLPNYHKTLSNTPPGEIWMLIKPQNVLMENKAIVVIAFEQTGDATTKVYVSGYAQHNWISPQAPMTAANGVALALEQAMRQYQ